MQCRTQVARLRFHSLSHSSSCPHSVLNLDSDLHTLSFIVYSAAMSEGKDGQPDAEDDGMYVTNFLAEPSNHPVSVDDFFNNSTDVHSGGCESLARQGGHGDKESQDKLAEVSRGDNQHAIGPSTLCEDFLMDSEFVDKDSECEDTSRKGSSFDKSILETHSSNYSGSESSTVGVSESSSISNEKPGLKNGTSDCQDQETKKTDQRSLIMYTSQNRRKLQSRLGLVSPPSTRDTNLTSFSDMHRDSEEASIVSNPRKSKQFSSARHTLVRSNDSDDDKPVKFFTESCSQKRLRKPPVRYIDEFNSYVPPSDERQRICGTPADKLLNVQPSSEHDSGHKTFKSFEPAQHVGRYRRTPNSPSGCNKVAVGLSNRVAVGLSKEFSPVTTLDSDEESDSDTPDNLPGNGFRNSVDRRKHQKAWTLPEVVKLVDGISQYGVGHWTEIQRLFFPTSTYRTPVDLRDKWRNLLKASSASMQNDQEERDEDSLKNGHRQLPIEILHRVGELSRQYPYPIKRTPNHMRAPKYHSKRK